MKKLNILLLAVLSLNVPVFSQSLPMEMHFSSDKHMLLLGDLPNKGLYDQSLIRSLYLNFSQPDYWQQLEDNYWAWMNTEIPATMVVDGITYNSVGVRFRGQSSFQQIPNSKKKPFGISLDFMYPNQDIMGYNKLNLNNGFMDKSFIREVFFQHQIKKHIPVAKSAYVQLYINGESWGLYPSVQQLNKDFYKEWFFSNKGTNWRADRESGRVSPYGDGTGALNYLGADTTLYKEEYILKSTDKINPWDDLVSVCNILNNTPLANLPSLLPAKMDVDRALWFLASEILFSDDDSYIQKGRMDYYVYWEKETGRIVPQEYDGNTVMNPSFQNWSPFYHENDVNYPLMNRLFAVPEYRQRYLAHLRTLIQEYFNPSSANAILDGYKAQIDALVQNDPKKLYTYADFQNEVTVLKDFITSRRNFLNANAEVAELAPVISNVAWYVGGNPWATPAANQASTARATVACSNGISSVKLHYSNQLTGNFSKVQMFDDGTHDDAAPGDGIYGAAIPGQVAGSWVRFYIEAVAGNAAKSVSYEPPGAEHNVYVYSVEPVFSSDTMVVINEVMAENFSTAMDEFGEYDDWIELHNKSSLAADISGYALTDNPFNLTKWIFPQGSIIPPLGYLIVWADEDGIQGPMHANFKLSSASEELMFLDKNGVMMDSTCWGQQGMDKSFARVPNGVGNFIIQTPTFNASNGPLSVKEIHDAELSITVFPNPANNRVKMTATKKAGQQLVILNSVGEQVYKENFIQHADIDISGLPSGLYFIQCGRLNKKLVVMH